MTFRLVFPACVLLAAGAGLAAAALLRGGFPLDDAYIYLQYARTAAEGSPFRYAPGEPLGSGVTSLAWFVMQSLLALVLPDSALVGATLVLLTLVVAAAFFLAARLVRHLGVPPALAWLPAGLCLLQPLWFHGAFNGMETTLFGVGLLLAARVWYGGSLGWLALLPLIRPEGIAAALLVLARRWLLTSDRAAFAGRALPVLLVAAMAVSWPWLLNGEPSAGWSAKALYEEPHPEVREFYTHHLPYYAGRALLFGVSGAQTQPPVDVAGDWFRPGAVTAWLWTLLLGGGALLAVVRRRGRALVILWVAGTLPCLVTNAWDAQQYRYLVGALPLLSAAAVAGWFGRTTGRRVRLVGGLLVVAVTAGVFLSSPSPQHRLRWLVRGGAETVRTGQLYMGAEIDARLPDNARVATHDVGAIAWRGKRPVVDLVGLVSPDLRGAYRHGSGALYEALADLPRDVRPTHAAVIPSWRPYLYRTLLFDRNLLADSSSRYPQSRSFELWSLAWPDTGLSAPFHGLPVDATFPGDTRWIAIDEVDVAHLPSEETHAWEQDLTPWQGTRDELTVVRDLGFRDSRLPNTVHAIEGGRRVISEVGFRMRARAGRTARLVLRLTAREATTVRVSIGSWDATVVLPASESRFHEAEILLDRDRLEQLLARNPGEPGGTLGIRVEAPGCVLYHAWLLQGAGR